MSLTLCLAWILPAAAPSVLAGPKLLTDDAAEIQPIRTHSPEAGPWPTGPWPQRDGRSIAAATEGTRTKVRELLHRADVRAPLIETSHFIAVTDLGAESIRTWLPRLDEDLGQMIRRLEIPPRSPALPGKIGVIVLGDRERFRLTIADLHAQRVPDAVHALLLAEGTTMLIVAHAKEHEDPRDRLLPEIARALLHAQVSPIRLPLWANEGLVDVLTDPLLDDQLSARARRAHGVNWLRQTPPGRIADLLGRTYEDVGWPDAESPERTVGALAVRLLLQDRPEAFGAWMIGVKEGTPWPEAMTRTIGRTPAEMIAAVRRHHMVND